MSFQLFLNEKQQSIQQEKKQLNDVFYNEDGELAISTYNIPKDGVGYSHSTVTESGEYVGGHGLDGRTWKERDDR